MKALFYSETKLIMVCMFIHTLVLLYTRGMIIKGKHTVALLKTALHSSSVCSSDWHGFICICVCVCDVFCRSILYDSLAAMVFILA
jgi:hypothetical protein